MCHFVFLIVISLSCFIYREKKEFVLREKDRVGGSGLEWYICKLVFGDLVFTLDAEFRVLRKCWLCKEAFSYSFPHTYILQLSLCIQGLHIVFWNQISIGHLSLINFLSYHKKFVEAGGSELFRPFKDINVLLGTSLTAGNVLLILDTEAVINVLFLLSAWVPPFRLAPEMLICVSLIGMGCRSVMVVYINL